MNIKQYQAGETIYRAGEQPDYAYVVEEGQVELVDEKGNRRVLGAGSLFGELSLIKDAPREENALALEPVTLKLYGGDQLESLVYQAPKEVQQLLMHLIDHVFQARPAPAQQAATAPALDHFFQSLERFAQVMEQRIQQVGGGNQSYRSDSDEGGYVRETLTPELLRELSDLGPVNELMDDDSVNDVLINGHGQVYVERHGKLELTNITFPDDAAVMLVADKIVRAIGRKVDRRRPLVDARLLDGSRVNIIAPPLAVDGTSISIRKFSKKKITLGVMQQQNNVSAQLAEFLRICGRVRLNVVISGGTGSGKTTLLNAVSQSIDHAERVVTIEDAAELQLQQPHVVRLETKPITAGAKPEEEVTMRDLVKNALRMRPDRIIVGEVRGPEAFDMMQAMNTGHEGSLTTIHANHPRDALSRLENMVSMANLNIPFSSIRYQIASAINLIVQVSRMRDGHRRITHVCEIVGMEGDIITMQDLFVFAVEGDNPDGTLRGQFRWTGIMPRFLRRVAYYGEADNLSKALGVRLPKL